MGGEGVMLYGKGEYWEGAEMDKLDMSMREADRKEIWEVLEICSSYAPDKCNRCPFDKMEDHGEDCRPVMAEMALKLLKEQQKEIERIKSLSNEMLKAVL